MSSAVCKHNADRMNARDRQRIERVRHVALDLDGTLYLGESLFPWTLAFLDSLKEYGIGRSFLTNNSSRSTHDYMRKLQGLGVECREDEIRTSTQLTIEHLRENCAETKSLFVLGTTSLKEELKASGFRVIEEDPQAVVVGFDTELSYDKLCKAAYHIGQGIPYFATHPDLICPTDEATLLVDCGAVCACLAAATGRQADAVLGKPDKRMLTGLQEKHSLEAHELLMAGDRLYTDICMANESGAFSVLVLSGEATQEDCASSAHKPDLVLSNIGELSELLHS